MKNEHLQDLQNHLENKRNNKSSLECLITYSFLTIVFTFLLYIAKFFATPTFKKGKQSQQFEEFLLLVHIVKVWFGKYYKISG